MQVMRIEMKKIQLLFFLLSMLCDVIIFDYPLLIYDENVQFLEEKSRNMYLRQ